MAGFSWRCFLLVIFVASQLYYILHFVGLRIYCTGTTSAYFHASHPICQEFGNRLFAIDFWLVAPLLVLTWFLMGDKKSKRVIFLRVFILLYLLLLRFAIASLVGNIEVKPDKFTAYARSIEQSFSSVGKTIC
ncbi:hypothetical protein [Pseudanabaena sp. PCC 6802]|uniref:hypothetical protein n=1 Tax=Pseudanabaena sp. PCC 6802 TaxID=118173 RepID=UPI00037ED96C|nr:hypothetical protein [Pseudanabaena sp. PCC 6802]